jgi:hypothetical protein
MLTPQTLPANEAANRSTESGAEKHPPPNTSGWLTREESARLLGVSAQTIKNYEKRGLLHPLREPRLDGRGREQLVTVHDPKELARLRGTLQAQAKQDLIDTSAWLTRNESTDALSISIQTLKNYESRGLLHPLRVPRRDTRGHEQCVVVYDPKELAKLPRGVGRPFASRESGELNARAFEMFEQGKNNREIVIALRETSERIRELREMWLDDGGACLVISPEAKTLLENMVGSFEGIADLVELVTAKLKPKT